MKNLFQRTFHGFMEKGMMGYASGIVSIAVPEARFGRAVLR